MPDPAERILLVEPDLKRQKMLARTIRAIAGPVAARTTLGALPDNVGYDVVIANYDSIDVADREVLIEKFSDPRPSGNHARLLLFAGRSLRNDLVRLAGSHTLTNVVARNNDEVDPAELIVTLRKLVDRDIFGIEKYFIWGVKPVIFRITSSDEKNPTLRHVEEYATALGVQPRFIEQLSAVADELITNAVYNAPRDAHGKPRYASRARSERVDLEPHEAVEVRVCCDGHRFGISIADVFGSLTTETLLDYLAKCQRRGEDQIDKKEGGAGLGFYLMYESLSHLIVNISPRHRTEIVGILDIAGSFRDFSQKSKSFNIFFTDQV